MRSLEIRWPRLALSVILLGFGEIALETIGGWGRFPFRPDWFWCLAVAVSPRAAPLPAMLSFAACGLARDLLIGPKVGAAALAFSLVGWLIVDREASSPLFGRPLRMLAAGPGAALAAVLRIGLEMGRAAPAAWEQVIILAVGQGALSLAAYGPVALFFTLTSFRPWRPKAG